MSTIKAVVITPRGGFPFVAFVGDSPDILSNINMLRQGGVEVTEVDEGGVDTTISDSRDLQLQTQMIINGVLALIGMRVAK